MPLKQLSNEAESALHSGMMWRLVGGMNPTWSLMFRLIQWQSPASFRWVNWQRLGHLFLSNTEILIPAFTWAHRDYCNALYVSLCQNDLPTVAGPKYSFSVLVSLHWFLFTIKSKSKILFVFKYLQGLAPIYLTDLLQSYAPSQHSGQQISL